VTATTKIIEILPASWKAQSHVMLVEGATGVGPTTVTGKISSKHLFRSSQINNLKLFNYARYGEQGCIVNVQYLGYQ
jgi:flagellar biosynthesis GTPase FlhF